MILNIFDIFNVTYLREAEDVKKRWQENREELYKKDLHDPDNHNGVITHLEPDILECEVKWALGSISTNKASGGRLAAERLSHAGHRELAFLGDWVADTVRARWAGFRQIAEAHGLRPVRLEIRADDRLGDWTHIIHEATRRLLRRKLRPTGIFCSCDAVARHVMRALEAHGVEVPRDVSLVGFDDDPIAEWTKPALTTVRQDFAALGTAAARALVSRCADRNAPVGTVTVPVSLVVRDTVGRAAS